MSTHINEIQNYKKTLVDLEGQIKLNNDKLLMLKKQQMDCYKKRSENM